MDRKQYRRTELKEKNIYTSPMFERWATEPKPVLEDKENQIDKPSPFKDPFNALDTLYFSFR